MAEIVDLERRIDRQVANLEADDATPALRRRIADRIAELEEALEQRRERAAVLAKEEAEAPPTGSDLGRALDGLPVLADRLSDLAQPELRALFDSLHMQVAFQPAEAAVDVEVTLFADESWDLRGEGAEVHSVPPTGQKSNKRPQVDGHVLRLSGRHAKLRRDGYRKREHP
jgi:hypothetical protein